MSQKLRLARAGTKKRPYYHIVVAERAQHWLAVGAQPTDRVLRFLDAAGLLKRDARNNPERAKPGAKATERAAAKVKAAEAAAAAANAPAEEPAA